jgi:hypothetical protein
MIDGEIHIFAGMRVLVCEPYGMPILAEGDATDLVGELFNERAQVIALPVERLGAAFFDLSSGLAGAVLQKFVNYHAIVAILGDVSAYEAKSEAFAAFARESNRGDQVWFLPDLTALARRIENP